MTSFIWRNTLSVSVGEMSRTQALECVRHFDTMARVYTDVEALLIESDILAVLYAPTVIKQGDAILSAGERVFEFADGPVTIALPMTRENFGQLPMSLTSDWINAALLSNSWLIETLKKAFSLTSLKDSEPKSGSAPSNEPSQATRTTTIIGE